MISDLIPDIASNAARSAHPDARAAHHNALSSAQLAATTSVDTAPSAHLERPDAHDKSNKYGEAYHRDPGVDVQAAERQFARFKHEVNHDRPAARASQDSSRLGRSPSKIPVHDVEKAASSTEDDDGDDDRDLFDLESEMRGSKQMEEEAGIKDKHIGVLWDGLTISGSGGVKTYVKVFPDAFVTFFNVFQTAKSILGLNDQGQQIDILKNFRGVVKPGEMCLVLGRPGSGCTTALKVLGNQRFGYTKIDGQVLYGPFEADDFSRRYRGEACYNMEDDIHQATLTVGQTLSFALDCKAPGKRVQGMSTSDFKDKVVDLMLKMFNIEHTKNTVVGNQFIRGVSGGERKRASIAEMMICGSSVNCWDNTTRGLDASTALDYAKSLRVLTNIYKTTTFVSLYQASENIYAQFDKVLVIDGGRCVYMGSAKKARGYFESLGFTEKPRQTTPDYLTGCTDRYEREYKRGRDETNAPSDSESMAAAFEKSEAAKELDAEMTQYREELRAQQAKYEDFQHAVIESKRHAGKRSVYTIPFWLQVQVLMRRQFFLKWQDKFALATSWTTSIVIAIILGTVWLNQPDTSAGAFTRGGLLFISLLFNAFQAFGELASTMLGRTLVNKHRAFAFHRPSALWIAQIGVDMLFSTVQITIFSVLVYFMCGLARTPGAFFTFVLYIISGYLAMTLFFRTVGCLCPDFDYAIKFAAIIITLFVLTSGYLLSYQDQQVWLRWIFYINALGLGFSALMMNEFKRIDLSCTAESLVPSGPGYGNISEQVCTLSGSVQGDPVTSGKRYIEAAFSYDWHDQWRNWGIIISLIVGFLACNAFFGEWVTWGAGGRTVTFFAKEDEELKTRNKELQEKKMRRLRKEGDGAAADLRITSKAVLTWEDLSYDVPVPSGQLRLLRNIYGYVKPGQLTALMGASGAGKTTLLDTLANRKNIGVIAGDMLIDGKPPGTAFQRGTSYAEQLDVHEGTATVREALRFSADLRQPYTTPQSEKHAYVEEVISLLEMEDIADAIIGDPNAGLAVEQRKRVTIGVELAARPELLLFLDEPTSGLDSQSAFNIVRFLRKLAAAGQAILCTIHQPNASLFDQFDRLLLLQKGGQTVYFGEIGRDAHILRSYFARHGAHCPPNENVAEWMLECIGAGSTPRIGDRDWGELWAESAELEDTKAEILRIKSARLHAEDAVKISEQEYATPLWHQIKVVNRRQQLAFWRQPNYGFTRLFNHVVLALITGLAFLQLDDSRASLQYRIFVIFQVTVLPALILAQVEPKYDMARMVFYRESASKAYRQFPFALSMVLAELPYSIICAIGFFVPIYYLPGFSAASDRAGYQFLMILICELFSVTLGQTIAALTPSSYISALLNPPVMITFALFCGVAIPKPQIPGFWRAWLYQLDPFTRLIGGMVVTELHGLPVQCQPHELNYLTAPPGQTCGAYMANFFAAGGAGYISDANATGACGYCAYAVGDQFYTPLGLDYANRWRDLGIMAAFIGSNLGILFLGSRFLNFNRR